MSLNKNKRSNIVEIGTGPAKVTIYTLNRKDGFPEFTLSWQEGRARRRRSLSRIDEARIVAQQFSVRLSNGWVVGDEVTKRDLELFGHCEALAQRHGVSLSVALDEWDGDSAIIGQISIVDAVRSHMAGLGNLLAVKSVSQVAAEFVTSHRILGTSEACVKNCTAHTDRFGEKVSRNISEITAGQINHFLAGLTTLGPTSKNHYRRTLFTMFGYARRQGYLDAHKKTAAFLSDAFKVCAKEIEIFTPEEMLQLLLACHARMLPMLAIAAFAGVRSAEIGRLYWENVKWDRGHIEIAGSKTKTDTPTDRSAV